MNAELEMRVRERTEELEAANRRLLDEAASRAAAEAQIRQLQKMEAVGQLTGGIAHDFNNMLAIVVGSLDIAKRSLGTDRDKAERFIANAMEGAQRGAQLTSRLLAFSRQQPLDPRPLDVNELVRDMSDLLLPLHRTRDIRLETVLARGALAHLRRRLAARRARSSTCASTAAMRCRTGATITWRRQRRLDEAYAAAHVDARPGDYVSHLRHGHRIRHVARGAGARLRSVLHDQEPGKGTGLGLSQVYGFVKQSDGHVKIDSQPGRGTTVRIYLPRYHG